MHIAQLVPTLHTGDAIGNNAIALKTFFGSLQAESEIFFLEADSEAAHLGKPVKEMSAWMKASSKLITILHYALPSSLNDLFAQLPGQKILIYHNITPPSFLTGYPHLQHISRAARTCLMNLKSVPDVALGDSEYNRRELEEMGFSETGEMPILLDFESYRKEPNAVLLNMFSKKDMINFLFVGRVTPNKCQHDIIRFYGFFKRYIDPRCRLFLVGKYTGFERYLYACMDFARRLNLGDIYFTGKTTHSELLAYYRVADLFISMSEHEGFGVPLIEAMLLDIPIMAFSAAAVPYTLSGGGVVFHRKERLIEIGELAWEILQNENLKENILRHQKKRLEYFRPTSIYQRWKRLLHSKFGMPF
ncbi:MAG: glycosyltransferase family 4 protein [bacterium]